VDLVAVERRDEGLVQQRDGLVRDLVGGALGASMRCACASSSLKLPIIAASSRLPSTMRSAWG
jgi:hypothetical protein